MNGWCFRPRFCIVKAKLGRQQPVYYGMFGDDYVTPQICEFHIQTAGHLNRLFTVCLYSGNPKLNAYKLKARLHFSLTVYYAGYEDLTHE